MLLSLIAHYWNAKTSVLPNPNRTFVCLSIDKAIQYCDSLYYAVLPSYNPVISTVYIPYRQVKLNSAILAV